MTQIQDELDLHLPSSPVQILAVNEIGQDSANDVAANGTDLPLLQDIDANNDGNSDVWTTWDVVYRDVRVLDANNELRGVLNLTTANLADEVNYDSMRSLIVEAATADRVAATNWQNRIEPLDVNDDGFVVPSDVLTIINRINSGLSDELPASGTVEAYFDVSGDQFVSPLDALRVIRHLNRFSLAEGEPEEIGDRAELGSIAAALATSADSSDEAAGNLPTSHSPVVDLIFAEPSRAADFQLD